MSYQRSLYIPYVSNRIGLEYIVLSMEHTFKLGSVARIEGIPHANSLSYQAFVYFDSWDTENPNALLIDTELAKENTIRMFHDNGQYWTVCPNKSDVQHLVHEPPKHMSLCLYVHPDTTVQTVWNVIQGLDLGMIYRIDDCGFVDLDRSFEQKHIWSHINPDVWARFVYPCVWCFRIHFQYWYRTKSARSFQELMRNDGKADIPVLYGSAPWTFYEEPPITDGLNPWVYTKP